MKLCVFGAGAIGGYLAVRLANDRPWREALAARIAAAAPSLDDWQPGLKTLAAWLHARIAQMGQRQ